MTVDEERLRHWLQTNLAALVGPDETALLMRYLPPVGRADVATKRDLDTLAMVVRSEMAVLRSDLMGEIGQLRSGLRGEIGQRALTFAAR